MGITSKIQREGDQWVVTETHIKSYAPDPNSEIPGNPENIFRENALAKKHLQMNWIRLGGDPNSVPEDVLALEWGVRDLSSKFRETTLEERERDLEADVMRQRRLNAWIEAGKPPSDFPSADADQIIAIKALLDA